MPTAFMNSQLSWLPAQDPYHIKPVNDLSMDEGGGPQDPFIYEELLTVDGCWGGWTYFLSGIDGPMIVYIDTALIVHNGVSKKNTT